MTKDPTHLPENVQAILKALPVKDQVVLRSYIAGLREHVKDLENKHRAAEHGDEHAHYHGHEKCTSDHGHSHSHDEKEEKCTEDHGHSHSHHKEEEVECSGKDCHDHSHEHKHEHKHEHEHEHEHKHAEHDHKHEHELKHEHKHAEHAEEDIPAWKKKAMESGNDDPMAAPFGGSWNVESSVDATAEKKSKMEE